MDAVKHSLGALVRGISGLTLVQGDCDVLISALTADSRQVAPGMLFAALPGGKADGRSYISVALKAGASALLVPVGSDLPPLASSIAILEAEQPRHALALMAAAFNSHAQPPVVTAVTGTNGKTSTATFVRQLWTLLGLQGASLGTLGLTAPGIDLPGQATTPDPVSLHHLLARMEKAGVTHLCMEASSHGLHQARLDGVRLRAGAFTNITRDHLDYHQTFDAYFAAKSRLFTDLLPKGATAVLNADVAEFATLKAIAESRGLQILSYGAAGEDLRIESREPTPTGQKICLRVAGTAYDLTLPLAGGFQASNALAALGLVIACGADPEAAVQALPRLKGVPGRLEKVGDFNGASIFVDYAHTPDALEVVLTALRPHVAGTLRVVFGCGGDRDAGKRPQMGAIAAKLADHVIVSDDNPRSEDPANIRRQVMAGCPLAENIGDRRTAIVHAVSSLRPGDVLLIAGKGHESGQIIGNTVIPFDDREEARAAITAAKHTPLWSAAAIAAATGGTPLGDTIEFACHGVSIDSRTVAKHDLFIAIQGPTHDGHDWVKAALESGAAGALVHRRPDNIAANDPLCDRLILVGDTFTALQDLGRAGRQRFTGRVVGVTGSVGKTSTKEMLALALSAFGRTHAAVGSFNNHWGVPLTLARMPAHAAFAVIEMGMNHANEIRPLTAMAQPHVAVVTTIAGAHIEHLGSLQAIADAKAEIFEGVMPGGIAVIPADAPHADRLNTAAQRAGLTCRTFGERASVDLRLISATINANSTDVLALIDGSEMAYSIGAAGHHWATNSLAVLGAVQALSPDPHAVHIAAHSLSQMHPPKGRGQRHSVHLAEGAQPLTVIDEAYNANPVSLGAALAALAALPRKDNSAGRRIVAIGDMLELGADAAKQHAAMAPAVLSAGIDLVFTAGPLSEHLFNALPVAVRGGHAENSATLAPLVARTVRGGDVVMAKGSAGSRMGRVIEALLALDTTTQSPAGGQNATGTAKE